MVDKAERAEVFARLLLQTGDADGACNRAYYAMPSLPAKTVGPKTYFHAESLPVADPALQARVAEAERLAGVRRLEHYNLVRVDMPWSPKSRCSTTRISPTSRSPPCAGAGGWMDPERAGPRRLRAEPDSADRPPACRPHRGGFIRG